MQIIVDIPKKYIDAIKRREFTDTDDLYERILKGSKIKLPKKHGRLIDADKVIKKTRDLKSNKNTGLNLLRNAMCQLIIDSLSDETEVPTVIERS